MSRRKKVPTKAMSLRLPSELAAELSAVARAEGVPISDVVRTAIGKHIATRRADEIFQVRLKEQMEEDRKALERLSE
jgi:post-segregation antitoxin (ccd killing protein)